MSTAHTPGPWIAEYDESVIGDGLVTAAEGDLTVCDVHDHGEGSEQHTHGEFKANARLIAAAPEMLEALREVARCNDGAGATDQEWNNAFTKVRAAIAKATGGEA